MNLTYTVMSKRKLRELVEGGYVSGWDDPRMPTLSAMRRRGYTPEALWTFNERLGVAKRPNTVEIQMLEHCVREDLNRKARRVMGVLHPLRLVIENYPEGQVEEMEAVNNPEDASMGTRKVPFSRTLYVEQDDFMEDPPRKFYRSGPRQRGAPSLRLPGAMRGLHERPADGSGDGGALYVRPRESGRQCS